MRLVKGQRWQKTRKKKEKITSKIRKQTWAWLVLFPQYSKLLDRQEAILPILGTVQILRHVIRGEGGVYQSVTKMTFCVTNWLFWLFLSDEV